MSSGKNSVRKSKEVVSDFFGVHLKFSMGKVVNVGVQKKQIDGYGWGWRYKVRIFGTYSDRDVEDGELHSATAMLGVTDGSGGGGRSRSLRITQGDLVFGFYMSNDESFPVIIGILGRTADTETESGYTAKVKKGLVGAQETAEQSGPFIPLLNDGKSSKSNTRATPASSLGSQLGIDAGQVSQLGALPNPPGWIDKGKQALNAVQTFAVPNNSGASFGKPKMTPELLKVSSKAILDTALDAVTGGLF